MKRIIAILLSFAPLFAFAQEHQIIGGYLLDSEDSFEELDAAVVTDAKRKDKNLDRKGMRFPGRAMMIPERLSPMPKVSVRILGTRLSYICQKAQMDRNAKPTRTVRLVFNFTGIASIICNSHVL